MAWKSTQGKRTQWSAESSLGTQTGSWFDFRLDGDPTFPTEIYDAIAQANKSHGSPLNFEDRPLLYKKFREAGIKIPLRIRSEEAPGTEGFLNRLFASAGCVAATSESASPSAVGTYTTTVAWTLDDDIGAASGAQLVRLGSNDSYWWPVVDAVYTALSKSVVPWMALPAAASDTSVVKSINSVYPAAVQVTTTNTFQLRVITRGTHTSGDDLCFTFSGCALSAIDEFEIKPGGDIVLTANVHFCDVSASAVALTDETAYSDTEQFVPPFGGTGTARPRFGFAAYDANGAIADTRLELMSAKINLGLATTPIMGDGTATTLNGCAGYMAAMPEAPKITIKVAFDVAYLTDFTALTASQTYHYLGFEAPAQSGAVGYAPAFALLFPRCYLSAPPAVDYLTESVITATLTYSASAIDPGSALAGYGAPWIFAWGR